MLKYFTLIVSLLLSVDRRSEDQHDSIDSETTDCQTTEMQDCLQETRDCRRPAIVRRRDSGARFMWRR